MADETKDERLDRELIELLNELRVMLPGVQVLFAFLLAVPFTQRFERVTELQRDVFTVSLACTALGTAFLIAPSSFHRLRFRKHDKEQLLVTGNRLAIAGTALLALAMTSALFVVLDMIYHHLVAVALTAAVAVVFGWLWYGLPLSRSVSTKDGRES